MGNTNTIPVVSQVKSTIQLATGDVEGAARTQERFFHEAIGVSQVTAAVYAVTGNSKKAGETFDRGMDTISSTMDGMPVVGHVKGVVHYAMGDDKKGDRSMLSASRTAGVMTAGAAGFVVGGPVGAVTAGMTTGSVFDVGHSVITDKPQGTVRAAGEFVENPSARTLYDAFAAPVSDGILGYQGGNIVASAQELFSLEEAPNTAVQEGGGYCAQAKAKFNGAYKIYKKVDAKKTLDEAMFPTRVSMEKYGNSKEEEQEK